MLLNHHQILHFKFVRNAIIMMALLFLSNDSVAQSQTQYSIPVVGFSEIQQILDRESDTLYILNFWATWCKPCVMELPEFEKVNSEFKDDAHFKMILVSLDFPEKIPSLVIPFIERRNLEAEVWVLDEPDANAWIDKIDPSWSGAIPATVIVNRKYRGFHEGMMTYDELKNIINKHKIN